MRKSLATRLANQRRAGTERIARPMPREAVLWLVLTIAVSLPAYAAQPVQVAQGTEKVQSAPSDRPSTIALLRLTIHLASENAPEEATARDDALARLNERLMQAGVERELANRVFESPPAPDQQFTLLVAARGISPRDYLLAVRRSYARFNAAEAAAQQEWAARHMTAARKYAELAAERLIAEARSNEEQAAQLRQSPFAVRRSTVRAAAFVVDLKNNGLSAEHRKLALESGLTTAELGPYLEELVATAPDQLGLSIEELLLNAAWSRRELATLLKAFASGQNTASAPRSESFMVGNPHDKEETVDLLIRRASMPPEWMLSIVEVAPPSGEKPKNPQIHQVEAGRHYRVRLTAKGEMRVATVLVPTGVVAENTTARWAVEGKIGDKLLGGIVQEMHVPAYLPDLKLPAVGSVDTRATDGPLAGATVFKWPVLWISAGITLLLGAVVLVFFWRRRRARVRVA